ncbi:MAG: GvpL/GvpF family gas vesicle protein [Prolixibacteraceae bacterium]
MDNDLIYVYCIINSYPQQEDDFSKSEVEFLPVDPYFVGIKFVSPDEFSEDNLKKKFADLEWIEVNARNHIRIISGIMKNYTVIPFKFGTIFKTTESLKKFIQEYSVSLAENFNAIQDKEEWSVKIYCDKKVLNRQMPELCEDISALERQILESSPGKAFLLNRRKNELIEQNVGRLMKINGQKCYDEYRNISLISHINNILPHEVTERQDDMILNAVFLIDKKKTADFVHLANLQEGKYRSVGFSFEVTGPWPPFSFVSMKEHK